MASGSLPRIVRASGCAAAVALASPGATRAADTAGFPDLRDPPTFVSQDRTLTANLTATAQDVTIGPVTFPGIVYNGTYAAPVLRVWPGDRMLVRINNNLAEPTNIHYHGIHTSPLGNSDNIHIVVPPNGSFLYSVAIPDHQPPGLYLYHAHLHGLSENQVMSGLSGALMVEGFTQQFPALEGITERLMVLKEYDFPDSDDPITDGQLHGRLLTVNGEPAVTIPLRPHETQLWHLGNMSADFIIHLALPNHHFRIIGEDGVARLNERVTDVLDLEPAGRMEVLVDAGDAGRYDLIAKSVLTGSDRVRVMGHVAVAGEPARPVTTLAVFPPREDLRSARIDATRTISFTQDNDTEQYFINGKKYDHDRIDVRIPLGATEEWIVRNDSDDFHEFHIHQVHFQVIAINNEPVAFDGYRDVVRVPERGSVTIRMAFTDPRIVGTFVYHCHVLKHEDKGMMGNAEVYDPAAAPRHTFLPNVLLRFVKLFRGNENVLPYTYCGL